MSYFPENPPLETKDLVGYVYRELQRISNYLGFSTAHSVEFKSVAPDKPRNGMLVGADGTNWDPGSGQGVYVYYANSWHFLG